MLKNILLWSLLSLLLIAKSEQCTVTMAYKPKAKEPYIFNDGSGIYKDVYGEALSRIGCSLKIIKLPKLRIIQQMKKGMIDFYPAFQYTKERAAYTFFIPSHIDHENVLVTRQTYPKIDSIKELISLNPILLKEIGGYSPLEGIPAKRFESTGINIDKKIQLLLNYRIDAFSYPHRILEYFLMEHPQVLQKIKIHRDFFHKGHSMHTLGFSRFSSYFSDKPNKYFDPEKPISQENTPTILDKRSIAYQFGKALEKMDQEGRIEQIYDNYRLKRK